MVSICAPKDSALHKKKFVLYKTKNKSGDGFLVKKISGQRLTRLNSSSTSHRTHVLLKPHSTTSSSDQEQPRTSITTVRVDEYSKEDVEENTYVRLDRSYNLKFFNKNYHYDDHGILCSHSLEALCKKKRELDKYEESRK